MCKKQTKEIPGKKFLEYFIDTEGRHNFSPHFVSRNKIHLTHFACEEIIERWGGRSIGCCCTGHRCRDRV